MAKETKSVENYSPELVASVVADYEAGMSVADIAKKIGKTDRSVRGKLVSMKKYRKPEKTVKSFTDEGPTKQNLLDQLTGIGFSAEAIKGLTNATKPALMEVINRTSVDDSEVESDEPVANAA